MNEVEVIEKLRAFGGKIEYFKIPEVFGLEAVPIFSKLLEEKKIKIEENDGKMFVTLILPQTYVPKIKIRTSFKAPLIYERYEIPEEMIRKRKISSIARFLAENFVNTYHVKTLKKKKNIIGTFLWDGKRYVEAEEIAKKYLEDIILFNKEKLEEKNIRTTSLLKEYLYHVRYMNLFEFEELPLISFNNCILNWPALMNKDFEKAFMRHDPLILVFNYIDKDIDVEEIKKTLENKQVEEEVTIEEIEEKAKTICPKSLKAFKDWVDEKWILLFEIIGYTLYPRYPFNKAVMLVGEGSNGKSTYLRLVREILGRENTTSIALKDICENRFSASCLYKKLANIYPDLPKMAIRDTGMFKILTGEDEISADRKFRDRITFTNYAKMLFSANELPKVNDMTLAFWRRWIVVQFPHQFERREGFFEETFTDEEIKGVITLSIIAFRNVLLRRKFSFEESEADYKEVWLKSADSVYAFLKDMEKEGLIKKDKASKELTSDVYAMYTQYCEDNDLDVQTKTAFSQRMQTYGFQIVKSGGKKYYKGIKIVKEEEKENIKGYL